MPDLDKKIFFFFQRLQDHSLNLWLAWPTRFGETVLLMSCLAVLIVLFDRKNPFQKIGLVSASLLTTYWVTDFLKDFFHRPRPSEFWQDVHVIFGKASNASFPSGHTSTAFAAAFILNCIYGKKMSWTYVVALWVGITRIYIGVHYPSDVLGGAVVGIACSALCWFVSRSTEKSKIN